MNGLTANTDLLRRILVGFVKDEVHKVGVKKAVLGLSGGIDSALVVFIAAEALGPENVHAICMPYKTSNPESEAHARIVAQACGVNFSVVPITPMVDAYFEQFPDADTMRRKVVGDAAEFRFDLGKSCSEISHRLDLSCRYTQMPAPTLFHPSEKGVWQVAEIPDFLILIISVFRDAVREYMVDAGINDFEPLEEVFHSICCIGVGYRAAGFRFGVTGDQFIQGLARLFAILQLHPEDLPRSAMIDHDLEDTVFVHVLVNLLDNPLRVRGMMDNPKGIDQIVAFNRDVVTQLLCIGLVKGNVVQSEYLGPLLCQGKGFGGEIDSRYLSACPGKVDGIRTQAATNLKYLLALPLFEFGEKRNVRLNIILACLYFIEILLCADRAGRMSYVAWTCVPVVLNFFQFNVAERVVGAHI